MQSPHIEALWRAQMANGLGVLAGDVAKMLPKPKGLPMVVVLKIDKAKQREGSDVFTESGEIFPEDIEGLKKYI